MKNITISRVYILAFETSCDDTSVALMQDDTLLALSTRTQFEHDTTGGVVPEVAARSHANAIFPCIDDVLSESKIPLHQIDYIACTEKPGLAPSLLTGIVTAKTLALSLKKPYIAINHIEGHIFSNLLERKTQDLSFPAVILTVSGGHTDIYLWHSLYNFELIGQTRDDAAGECFDKVSKMLGMGFPGGAQISQLAQQYKKNNPGCSRENIFPLVLLEKGSLDFSFSGLKSAVKRYIDDQGDLSSMKKSYIAYEFEEVMTDILTTKIMRAKDITHASMVCLAGGVSANSVLREKIAIQCKKAKIPFLSPSKILYSMDNAAMIGIRAYYQICEM